MTLSRINVCAPRCSSNIHSTPTDSNFNALHNLIKLLTSPTRQSENVDALTGIAVQLF